MISPKEIQEQLGNKVTKKNNQMRDLEWPSKSLDFNSTRRCVGIGWLMISNTWERLKSKDRSKIQTRFVSVRGKYDQRQHMCECVITSLLQEDGATAAKSGSSSPKEWPYKQKHLLLLKPPHSDINTKAMRGQHLGQTKHFLIITFYIIFNFAGGKKSWSQ